MFATMWLAGPITGYTATSLIAFVWERRKLEMRDVMILGLFESLLAISTLLLTLFAEL